MMERDRPLTRWRISGIDSTATWNWRVLFSAALCFCVAGCSGSQRSNETAPTPARGETGVLLVSTVNYPLKYFAERIGGSHVAVTFPAPPAADPAFWSPAADAVAGYQQADLILLNGAGYARWTTRVSLPPSKMVDTSESLKDRYMVIQGSVTHGHGPAGEQSHGETAFTTWIDPTLAVEHARAIREAFAAARPEHEAAFQSGFAALEADLVALDRDLEEAFRPLANEPILASHPVYQYLAQRYGLDVKGVHFEPDEVPDERAWRGLRKILASHPARWMIWEGEPVPATAEALAALDVRPIVFEICENVPPEGDYLVTMRRNLNRLRTALRSGARS